MKNISEYLDKRDLLLKTREELNQLRATLNEAELHAVLGPTSEFKSYSGGGGPSPQQIHGNNVAILSIIRELGFECACIVPEDEILEDGSDDFDIVVFRVGDEQHDVGYDRWGYVSESGHLDQACWTDTVNWIVGLSKLIQ